MPNWRKVIVSGSDASLYSLNVTNGITGSLFGTASYTLTASYVNPLHQIVEITSSTTAASLLGSGSGLFTVDGTYGRIFTIDDTNSGSLFSVVTGSVPILEVFSSKAVVISGSLNVSNGITGSLLGSASYAITASYALNGGSGGGTVYVMDQGNNQGTASYFNFIGTGVTSSITNGTASISIPGTIVTGSNAILVQTTPATTWSFAHNLGEQFPVFTIFDSNNNVIVPLNINAYSANAASIYWSFPATGKAVAANCGLSGSIQTSSFAESASYAFTASYVQNAQTASYILNAVSSSYAITSSFAYAAISASYAPGSDTSISASYALTASYVQNAVSASYVQNAQTASYVLNAVSSSYALSASYAVSASYAPSSDASISASYASTASYVENAQTASYILNAVSASYAVSSSYALSASYAVSSSQANNSISSSYANSSSYATSGSYALSASQAANATLFNSLSSSQFAQLTVDNTFTGNNAFNSITASYLSAISASIEYLYVIYQTSSIIYSSGSNQFGDTSSDVQTLWGQVDIKSGPVTVTGSINASGGITGSLQGSASYAISSSQAGSASYAVSSSYSLTSTSASYAFSASHALQAGGALFAESASNAIRAQYAETIFPYTGSGIISGSLAITGSLGVTNTITLDGTLSRPSTTISSVAGPNNLLIQGTGSYTSAFFKYTVSSGSNARAGEVMTVWNGTTTNYTDVSTTDIGDTSAVTCSANIVSGDIHFTVLTPTSGWDLKSLATYM